VRISQKVQKLALEQSDKLGLDVGLSHIQLGQKTSGVGRNISLIALEASLKIQAELALDIQTEQVIERKVFPERDPFVSIESDHDFVPVR